MNGRQELVELDLLIYSVPGFSSIRSLSAEILHFVWGPLHFIRIHKEIAYFVWVFITKYIRKSMDFLEIRGFAHEMQYLCAHRIGLRQIQVLGISGGRALQAPGNSL